MIFNKDMLRVYAITDRTWVGKQSFLEQIEEALKSGITMLQLREKDASSAQLAEVAKDVLKLCKKYNVPLIIDDDYETAIKVGADGVHVGIDDKPVSLIRKIAPKHFIIGATAKTIEQAQKAMDDGADYLGVGAVFPSPTKKNAIRITRDDLKKIISSVDIPVVAIGGITLQNIEGVYGCGASGVAVISAVFGADSISKAVAQLIEKTKEL